MGAPKLQAVAPITAVTSVTSSGPRPPKIQFPRPQPVQFVRPSQFKLAQTWFEPAEVPLRFSNHTNGAEALGLGSLNKQIERLHPQRRALEVHVTWKDQVYDSRLYLPGETISIGTDTDDLYTPILPGSFVLGRFDGQNADFFLTKGVRGYVYRSGNRQHNLEHAVGKDLLPRRGKYHVLSLSVLERCVFELGCDLKINVRYSPMPRQLSKAVVREPDRMLRRALTYSSSFHFAFLLLALLFAPAHEIPRIKHLSPRVARLLVQKSLEPEPPPKPPKIVATPPEKPVAPPKQTLPPRRWSPPPKKVVIRPNQRMKVINKINLQKIVLRPTPSQPVEPNVNQMGALAALGALGTPTVNNPKNLPVAININPNAGGASGLSTKGVIGALKAKGGQLSAAGTSGVITRGKGFGSGTGYGVQGLKGMAGTRGVNGSVIGQPELLGVNRTEGLTQKQVMDVVKQHLSKIQQCYERSLLSQSQLSGRIEYEWEISARGAVQWVKVKRSDVANGDGLNTCVSGVFKRMKFPLAKNGESTTPSIGFPFGRL